MNFRDFLKKGVETKPAEPPADPTPPPADPVDPPADPKE